MALTTVGRQGPLRVLHLETEWWCAEGRVGVSPWPPGPGCVVIPPIKYLHARCWCLWGEGNLPAGASEEQELTLEPPTGAAQHLTHSNGRTTLSNVTKDNRRHNRSVWLDSLD